MVYEINKKNQPGKQTEIDKKRDSIDNVGKRQTEKQLE